MVLRSERELLAQSKARDDEIAALRFQLENKETGMGSCSRRTCSMRLRPPFHPLFVPMCIGVYGGAEPNLKC
jgi:hypothetical protein